LDLGLALLLEAVLESRAFVCKRPRLLSSSCRERVETRSEESMLSEEPLPLPVDTEDGKVVPELRARGMLGRSLLAVPVLLELDVEADSGSGSVSRGGGGKTEAGRRWEGVF